MTINFKLNLLSLFKMPLFGSQYVKNILTLLAGTGLAQAIPILLTPFLVRIYSPEQFGVFAFYLGCTTVGVALVTGKLEMASMLPRKDKDAIHLLSISLSFSMIITTCFFLFIVLYNQILDTKPIENWVYYLPLGVFFTSAYNIFLCWLNRKKKYRVMSENRIVQSGAISFTQIIIGFFFSASTGLLLADVIGKLLSSILILKKTHIHPRLPLQSFNLLKKIALIKRYSSFLKFSLAAGLANIVAFQLPYLIIPMIFSSTISGLYFLVFRVLMSPISLIGLALLDVFRNRALDDLRLYGNCRYIFLKTLLLLFAVGIIPTVCLLLAGQEIFILLFGSEWREAGLYAQIMAPMALLRLLSAPLSYVFILREKLVQDLILQVVFLIMVSVSLYIGYLYSNSTVLVMLLSLSGCIFYSMQLIYSFKLSSK